MMNEFNGLGGRHLELWYPRRPVLFEKAFEGLVQTGTQSGPDQGPRYMGPARRAAICQVEYFVSGQRNVHGIQPRDHLAYSILSHGLKTADLLPKPRVFQID